MTLDVVITSALLYYNFGFPFLITFGATYIGYAALTLTYAKVRSILIIDKGQRGWSS